MSDNGKQMATDMYYFVWCSCAILIDSETSFRLYFALVIWRERRRQKPSSIGIVGLAANRGNPKRPATLWTVTYRLGPSFRGLR
jgi:hypothetical protein